MAKKLKLYTRDEVARILGIHPKTLDRHILRSCFPAPRIVAGQKVWTREDITVGIDYGERFRQPGGDDEPDPPEDDDGTEKRTPRKKSD